MRGAGPGLAYAAKFNYLNQHYCVAYANDTSFDLIQSTGGTIIVVSKLVFTGLPGTTNFQSILSKGVAPAVAGDGTGTLSYQAYADEYNSSLTFQFSSNGQSFDYAITAKCPFGKPFNWGVVTDGVTVALVINGQIVGTKAYSGQIYKNSTTPLVLGSDTKVLGNSPMNGNMSVLRFYDFALALDKFPTGAENEPPTRDDGPTLYGRHEDSSSLIFTYTGSPTVNTGLTDGRWSNGDIHVLTSVSQSARAVFKADVPSRIGLVYGRYPGFGNQQITPSGSSPFVITQGNEDTIAKLHETIDIGAGTATVDFQPTADGPTTVVDAIWYQPI
jgi:hypothetical protein